MGILKWFFRIVKENFSYKEKTTKCDIISHSDKLSVMTFNIRRDTDKDGVNCWTNRKESIVKMIKEYGPDVICMQEVMPHMAKYLVSELSGCYGHIGLECFTNKELSKSWCFLGEGMITFYKRGKFSLVDSDYMKLFDYRAINVRRASLVTLKDCNNKEYHIFNTHFCHKDSDCRKKSFDKIHNYIKNNNLSNVYVAGDFNCEITRSEAITFSDNFNHNIPDKKGSINSYVDLERNITIDFVFTDNEMESSEVIRKGYDVKFLSDHYPVICYFNNINKD